MTEPRDQRGVRRDYEDPPLVRAALAHDPFEQFERWFHDATAAGVLDATAMALATASAAGEPAVRIVLLKHFDHGGFCWYSDYRSRKGAELAANPRASLLFHWRELNRQVRIEGVVQRLSAADSDAYFASRPRASQLAAAASVQSAPIVDRATLEARVAELDRTHAAVARPPDWGGYRLAAAAFEFWQGRAARLHDRFRYARVRDARAPDETWTITRLQP